MQHTGTLYVNFSPVNPFEIFLKSKVLVDDVYDENTLPIETLYRIIYNTVDPPSFKMAVFKKINDLINDFLNKYNNKPESMRLFKNDSSVIYIFQTIAIKIFNLNFFRYIKHDELYSILLNNKCENLEKIIEAFPINDFGIYVAISKVEDTNNYKNYIGNNLFSLTFDINNALNYLKEHNWTHGDVSIDNIGFDEETNNYVLFDFGFSKYFENLDDLEKAVIHDMNKFKNSIKFNIEYKYEQFSQPI